jgi:hypothetical protein
VVVVVLLVVLALLLLLLLLVLLVVLVLRRCCRTAAAAAWALLPSGRALLLLLPLLLKGGWPCRRKRAQGGPVALTWGAVAVVVALRPAPAPRSAAAPLAWRPAAGGFLLGVVFGAATRWLLRGLRRAGVGRDQQVRGRPGGLVA